MEENHTFYAWILSVEWKVSPSATDMDNYNYMYYAVTL